MKKSQKNTGANIPTIELDGETLTVDELVLAAKSHARVKIFPEQEVRIKASRDLLDGFVKSGRTIYGVTTAVGGFVNWLIPENLAEKLIVDFEKNSEQNIEKIKKINIYSKQIFDNVIREYDKFIK